MRSNQRCQKVFVLCIFYQILKVFILSNINLLFERTLNLKNIICVELIYHLYKYYITTNHWEHESNPVPPNRNASDSAEGRLCYEYM